jgi:hypothetical protein
MIEIIKLAKQYKLEALFRACEGHFKELMVQSFDCTNLISLKGGSSPALPSNAAAAGGSSSLHKRNKINPPSTAIEGGPSSLSQP